jgi:hypothetical protein
MPGKSLVALTRHKRNIVRLCFFERSVTREVNAGEIEISAANSARNLVDGGGSASPVGQREGISFIERVIATRSQQDLGDHVTASGCDLDRGPASQNGKPCRIPACY